MHAQVYWLGLDYLQVAAAALRWSASLTALMYIEYWCEEQTGGMQLPDNPAADQVLLTLCSCPLCSIAKVCGC